MNELNLFEGEAFSNVPPEIQLMVFGAISSKLAEIIDKIHHSNISEKEAWEMIRDIDEFELGINCHYYDLLRTAVVHLIIDAFQKDEFYYHGLFNKYAHLVIPGCEVVERTSDGKNIPDSWIFLDGKYMPVEVKLHKFDKKAKNQLERYMRVYNTLMGVAVARELTVSLPDNIVFVGLEELIRLQREDKP